MNGVVIQSCFAVALGNPARQHGAYCTVRVLDRQVNFDRMATFNRRFCQFDQLMVQSLIKAVVLILAVVDSYLWSGIWFIQQRGQIQAFGFPVINCCANFQTVPLANHLVEPAITQFGHELPDFLCYICEEIDDMLRCAWEQLPQFRILGRNTNRARVQMTFAHHDTALRNQGRGGDAKFVGAQHGTYHHVPTRAQAAVHLHRNAAAQAVHDQRLMGFRQSNFPWTAGALD